MNDASAADVLLYLAIAVLVIWRVVIRQVRGYRLSVRGLFVLPAILVAIGVVTSVKALPGSSGTELALLGADLAALAALGVFRAASVKITAEDGYAFAKGSSLTLVLWLVTIGVRIGFLVLGAHLRADGPLTSASLALSIGLSVGLQNALAYRRARGLGLRVATGRPATTSARG
ncbi:hypothetical protein [Amycolatopsis sp. CA-230715]|uniref:hypothetical protein n=1 Tax=Amycolatopsis sp. CA-230715 TaxID=2745196 RepID=UPI001C01F11E|nr:hypothetical protein [Amycolatopsis sp. CA-230715]QWF77571.1 hypothetical protein HUW46_00963 [Amycolatopsis sp. CA-230715]